MMLYDLQSGCYYRLYHACARDQPTPLIHVILKVQRPRDPNRTNMADMVDPLLFGH